MHLPSYLLLVAISLIGISIVSFGVYFMDMRIGFSVNKVKNQMFKRMEEIRGIFKDDKAQQLDRIQQIVEDYNKDLNVGFLDYIRMTINQSGLKISHFQFWVINFFLAAFGLVFGILLHNYWLSFVLMIGLSQSPWFFIRFKFHVLQASFRNTSGEVIRQIYNNYRTNKNMMMSIKNAVSTLENPFKQLFEMFLSDLENNISFDVAIDRMMHQVMDPNFRLFCILVKVSERLGISVVDEVRSIKEIYDDAKEVRYQLMNEMKKDKIESIILGILPVAALVISFIAMPNQVIHLIQVPWINNILAVCITLIVIGFLMLPAIFTLDTE